MVLGAHHVPFFITVVDKKPSANQADDPALKARLAALKRDVSIKEQSVADMNAEQTRLRTTLNNLEEEIASKQHTLSAMSTKEVAGSQEVTTGLEWLWLFRVGHV